MTGLAKILRTTAFRTALIYLAVFVLSAVLVIGYIYYNTNVLLARQLRDTIAAEVEGLAEQYRQGGIVRLVGAVETRAANAGNGVYLLSDVRGRTLAGNFITSPEALPDREGWVEFAYQRYQGDEPTAHLGLARVFQLPDGFMLIVGRDIQERRRFETVITSALAWGVGLTVIVGLVGGFLVSRRLLTRVDAMSDASRRIMAGNLAERVPRNGSGDELDRLAESLNAMLERIELLMRGLKEVSDNIAHDLKTPLTRLRARVEQTLAGATDEAAYRAALEQTIAESDQLIATFNALLSIARAEAGEDRTDFAEADGAVILHDLAELYEPVVEEQGGRLILSAPDRAMFRGNRELVSQALANLIDNAVNHGLAEASDKSIALSVEADNEAVIFVVADCGPGVAADDRERVQERFVRLEQSRSRPGSGLGLSLASAVAQLHSGSLDLADNAPGLKVTLRLPR